MPLSIAIHNIRYPVTTIIALIIGVESLVVMLGWILGIDWMTRIVPFGINMKFITAVLFFICAIGLYLMALAIEGERVMAHTLLPGVALIIFIVTTTLLVSKILSIPTGVESLFVSSIGPIDFTTAMPTEGWPAIPTLFNFILFALAGITALFPGTLRDKFILGTGYFILLVGCIAVAGYLFNLPALYYEVSFSTVPMAFNTALCFILLGFGLTRVLRPGGNQ